MNKAQHAEHYVSIFGPENNMKTRETAVSNFSVFSCRFASFAVTSSDQLKTKPRSNTKHEQTTRSLPAILPFSFSITEPSLTLKMPRDSLISFDAGASFALYL